MSVDTSKVERLLDALLRRTSSGDIQWDDYRTGMVTTYSTSLANGSILLREGRLQEGELIVLDDAGQEVFRQGLGVASLAAMAASGYQGGQAIAAKSKELLDLVKAQGRRSDQVLTSLLDEIESA